VTNLGIVTIVIERYAASIAFWDLLDDSPRADRSLANGSKRHSRASRELVES